MAVVGLGLDICSIERMRRILESVRAERFLERVFTDGERATCSGRADAASAYAARFAAKEALVKALGAPPGQLIAAVFRRAFLQIAAGSAVGVLAAYLVGRYVPIEQIGGLPIPGVLPGAAAFMLLVGILAAWGPARRGLRIDPTEALRSE